MEGIDVFQPGEVLAGLVRELYDFHLAEVEFSGSVEVRDLAQFVPDCLQEMHLLLLVNKIIKLLY